jgi:squalene synthase HpnC
VVTVPEAYTACERFASAHYENFPVASFLLPRDMRPHVAAIYAFARAADDFADEGTLTDRERHQLLDDWLARLHACAGTAGGHPNGVIGRSLSGPDAPDLALDPESVFVALGETIRTCRLPVTLFADLIDAFRQDITTDRYDSWEALLDYSRRSANPVGRLVLRVAGYVDGELDDSSDAVCTALQLTNFWQDLDIDWKRGRLYVPRIDRESHGASEIDLARRVLTPPWRDVLQEMARRTRALFDRGRRVCDGVSGRLGYELRVTWLGGRLILERLEETGFDVFTSRPTLGAADVPALLWRAARWRAPDAA